MLTWRHWQGKPKSLSSDNDCTQVFHKILILYPSVPATDSNVSDPKMKNDWIAALTFWTWETTWICCSELKKMRYSCLEEFVSIIVPFTNVFCLSLQLNIVQNLPGHPVGNLLHLLSKIFDLDFSSFLVSYPALNLMLAFALRSMPVNHCPRNCPGGSFPGKAHVQCPDWLDNSARSVDLRRMFNSTVQIGSKQGMIRY